MPFQIRRLTKDNWKISKRPIQKTVLSSTKCKRENEKLENAKLINE